MNRRAMMKPMRIFVLSVLLLVMPGCQGNDPAARGNIEGSGIGGPFTLTDKAGRAVRWADFDGKYRIVYFGYTFCPDACPLDMAATMRGFAVFAQQQPALAAQVQPMFITIDPARDTPQAVGEFAAAFSPRLLGLTGTHKQVEAAAKAFKVYYARGKDTSGGYLMDHSRVVYLMGRKGEPITMLPADQGPKAMAAELAQWVR
jgi:protein SCO1/2